MILPSHVIAGELVTLGCLNIAPSRDPAIYLPTVNWLQEFAEWFKINALPTYVPGKMDCEDICIKAISLATDALVANNAVADAVGHGLGFAHVTLGLFLSDDSRSPGLNGILPRAGSSHMTIICRCSDDNFYFYEPQTALIHEARNAIDSGRVATFLWCWM